MQMESQFLEQVWGEIISSRPQRIKRMFMSLDLASQKEVIQHLKRMATEEGWQAVQVRSAREAIAALDPIRFNNNE
jgi:hypothetical protein